MRTSRAHRKHRTRLQQTLCCSCRLSVSSSEEAESAATSERFPSISSLAHAMVQERLDQMIRERREAVKKLERRRQRVLQLAEDQKCCCTSSGGTKFVVMVAMEKRSYDPREDFRDSMAEMITANKIEDPKDLRCLLNYYLSMNSEEYQGMILEVFHDVLS